MRPFFIKLIGKDTKLYTENRNLNKSLFFSLISELFYICRSDKKTNYGFYRHCISGIFGIRTD